MAEVGVNWREVTDLSKRTLENYEEFEDARDKYEKTIASLSSCWKGSDAKTFITNALHFVRYLKNDSEYLGEMGHFFDTGAKKYNAVVDEHEQEMKKYNERFEEDYLLEDRSEERA